MESSMNLEKSLHKLGQKSRRLTRKLKKAQKQLQIQFSELQPIEVPQRKQWALGMGVLLVFVGIGLSVLITRSKAEDSEAPSQESSEINTDLEETETVEEEVVLSEESNDSWLSTAQDFVQNLQNTGHQYLRKISRK